MKLFLQVTILATFIASMASAQATRDNSVLKVVRNRQLGYKKSKSFSLDDAGISDPHAEGEIGCRKECSDKRFTMVCEWEADKKKKKSYKSRRLGEQGTSALDFEDEIEEERELAYVSAPDGRRLGVELDNVECILGVGKKDSDDSSEDYEEYKERLKFPDDKWTITIWDNDSKAELIRGTGKTFRDYYKFTRKVEFEDIEDPNNSGDEITIVGTLEIELFLFDSNDSRPEVLVYDDSDLKFSC